MSTRSYYDIHKTFLHSFSVRDIAEPLPSFDAETPSDVARSALLATALPIAGVREGGFVARYIALEWLGEGRCGDHARPFEEKTILPDTARLTDVVHALNEHPVVFVRVLGSVGGFVRRADLEDPPVRMWLFGLLTSLEQRFLTLIEARFRGDEWLRYVSPARVEKARVLMEERSRRRMEVSLLSCLQFADKAQIMVRDETLRTQARFVSRKRGEETIKGLERLRNNLAHAQEIAVSDWEMIVRIVENLDAVLERGLV